MPEINTGNVPNTDTAPSNIPVVTPGVAPEQAPIVVAPQVPQPKYQPELAPTPAPQVVTPTVQDRTREQFEKLLESNSKLFEANEVLRQELEERKTANQQFAPIQQPPVQTPIPPEVDPMDFIELDAYGQRVINEKRLKTRIAEVNAEASRAVQAVKQYTQVAEQREIERQNREAFTVYPELDPNKTEKFDKIFSNNTRALIYDSLINPQDYGGKSLDFKEAADRVRAQYQGITTMQGQSSEQQQSKDAQTLKQQASLGANGQQPMERTNASADVDYETLRLRTRMGDRTALAQRIYAAEQAARGEAEAS
jgi:hypothetical protein